MKVLKMVAKEFVYGGHLLSFGASGVTLTVTQLLNLPFSLILVLIPYLGSQIVYSYNHIREIRFDVISNPERVNHINNRKRLTEVFLRGYLVVLTIFLLMTNPLTSVFVISIILSGVAYTDYFKIRVAQLVTGSKNFYSALFWALQILLIPLYYGSMVNSFYGYFFWIVFLTAFVNSSFFDIKDVMDDKRRGLKTFPVLWGVSKTVYFLYIVKLLTLVPLLVGVYNGAMPKETLIFLLFVVYGFYYLSKAKVLKGKELRNLSYIIADGEYILWPFLIFIMRIIFELILKCFFQLLSRYY